MLRTRRDVYRMVPLKRTVDKGMRGKEGTETPCEFKGLIVHRVDERYHRVALFCVSKLPFGYFYSCEEKDILFAGGIRRLLKVQD
jgi:hypothetical protein